MASRKEQKEQARAQREALEAKAQAAAQRKKRLVSLGIAVGVAVVAVVVAIVISSGGGSKGGVRTGTEASAVVSDVASTLAGAEQSGARIGQASAPVTMDYYGDLQCPVCQEFTEGALGQIISTYVVPGKLKINYRAFETATQDPDVFATQQIAALAAGRQNRLWQFIELFYRQQGAEGSGYVTAGFINGIAQQVPDLNIAKWNAARKDPALANQVKADETAAGIAGATGTPTLVVKGPKGTKSETGNVPFSDVQSMISAVS